MKFFIEWQHFNAFLLNCALLLRVPSASLAAVLAVALRYSNRHVEVSDLVGILARRRDLDGSSPVVVEVAQSISQLLQLDAGQA